jgi:SAM-dependent methyltransferase
MKTHDAAYLSSINDPLDGSEDKYDLRRYLESEKSYDVLEIGPGSGSAIENAIVLSQGWYKHDNYFALDIDKDVLRNLYTNTIISQWAGFYPIQASAVHLPFKDNAFDIVNLSAVAHEVSSYSGGLAGLQALATECARVLRVNGSLILRELEGVELQEPTECTLVGPAAIGFFSVFFKRFLDRKYTSINKPLFYEADAINVVIDCEGIHNGFSYQHMALGARISIAAPLGFIRETQRHFITFVDAFAPEYFYEIKSTLDGGDFLLAFKKKSSVKGFLDFLSTTDYRAYQIGSSFQVSGACVERFREYVENKFLALLDNCAVDKGEAIRNALVREGIEFGETDDSYLIPVGAAVLFQEILSQSGNAVRGIAQSVISWAKREGDEHYLFGSVTDMVINFVENSIQMDHHEPSTFSGLTCLVPIKSKYIPREKYAEVLQNSFVLKSGNDNFQLVEGKRIVHFRKVRLEDSVALIGKFFYENESLLTSLKMKLILQKIERHIRDFIFRSLSFNQQIKTRMEHEDPFVNDILLIDDEIENIGKSPDIQRMHGKHIILIGRIGTKKESFHIYFKRQGYEIISLSCLLAAFVNKNIPSRKDLFVAGKLLKRENGLDYLARLALEQIKACQGKKCLILGCRLPEEVKYITDNLDDVVVVGLFPDKEQLIRRLEIRYPDTNRDAFSRWINWNDGEEYDHYTNHKICMQMCDFLFCGVDDDIVSPASKK